MRPVCAVGVQDVADDHAEVIAVVHQVPQPTGDKDSEIPSDLVLAMSLLRTDGQWKLENIAAVTG
jgi:hypothetical protein